MIFREFVGISARRDLCEHALRGHEAQIAARGPLVTETGVHTGRSRKDKFIVRDAGTDPVVWWNNNNSMSTEHFDALQPSFSPTPRARRCSHRLSTKRGLPLAPPSSNA